MKTERIKVTDLHTLQMEKQRLQMHIDFMEEQITDKVSTFFYELPVDIITSILPFGLGNKPGVIKGIRNTRNFISGFLGGDGNAPKREIIKAVFPLAKAFVVRGLSGMLKKKKT
jgi:hypothetical protein